MLTMSRVSSGSQSRSEVKKERMPPRVIWLYPSHSFVILIAVISNIVEVNGDIYRLIWYAYHCENL